jgi:hypothetical protein
VLLDLETRSGVGSVRELAGDHLTRRVAQLGAQEVECGDQPDTRRGERRDGPRADDVHPGAAQGRLRQSEAKRVAPV